MLLEQLDCLFLSSAKIKRKTVYAVRRVASSLLRASTATFMGSRVHFRSSKSLHSASFIFISPDRSISALDIAHRSSRNLSIILSIEFGRVLHSLKSACSFLCSRTTYFYIISFFCGLLLNILTIAQTFFITKSIFGARTGSFSSGTLKAKLSSKCSSSSSSKSPFLL